MTVLDIPTPDPRAFDLESRPFAEAVSSRYAIKKMIGRGGMGIVYLARDRRLDRLVAIKTLPPQLAADENVRQRFLRETRTAGAMSHPNIVQIHGADEVAGHVFFVMGFVDGDSLAAHIRAEGRLEPRQVAVVLTDVAAALTHAHDRGIIHRDIKAENILIERASGRALVTDFGIARLAEAAPLTATGQMLGTVYYVSPEQVGGHRIDARSDLYSLGVVGFFALTGTFPFDAELASAVLIAHVNRPAPPVRSIKPGVPPMLASIIDRCLAKNPEQRFASAAELSTRLAAALAEIDGAAAGNGPRRVSATEAQSVWKRAAELQSNTGVQPRGNPVLQSDAGQNERILTSGYRVGEVRDAAREAGINTQYIDHALAERGLVPGAQPAPARQRRSIWAGVPLDIVERVDVEGEILPAHFDRVFNILRDATVRAGTTTASKREIGWSCDWPGHHLDVSIVPDAGKTAIGLSQSIRRMAATTMTASVLFFGGVLGPLTAYTSHGLMRRSTPHWVHDLGIRLFISRSDANSLAIALGVAVSLLSIPLARMAIGWLRRQNVGRLRALTEALTANVRLAIEEDRQQR
jgi:hypothetical protein